MSRRIAMAAVAPLVVVLGGIVATPASQLTSASASAKGASFLVGAAVGDFTPPPFGTPIDGQPDAADCIAGTPLESVFTGPRIFDFEEPYIDRQHLGHYTLGDPYVDCDHSGRWEGNYLGGGTGNPRYYSYVLDPVTARAMAVENGAGKTIVVEVLDQEGLFNVYEQAIRDQATTLLAAQGKHVDGMFLSATHDEEAPDSLGLGGENELMSGTDNFFIKYMEEKSAQAIVAAVDNMQPAHIRYAQAIEPANLRQCWSSYPYVDDQLMPTLQAVSSASGKAIVTLTSVSQHAETLGFDPAITSSEPGAPAEPAPENQALSADWPHWFRSQLEQDYGGVAIEMAGAVGSVETPQVFADLGDPSGADVSRVPQQHVGASHPAGCNTVFEAPATPAAEVALGYYNETHALGVDLAGAVQSALAASATWSQTSTIWGERSTICVPLKNVLFAAAAAAGTFANRSGSTPVCAATVPAAPNGTTLGTNAESEVAAYRIGDGEFMSVPGEVFPFTYLGSFLGPEDMPYGQYPMTPELFAHMHTPYRFVDGLAEDMLGYIFPAGNAVGIPGQHPIDNDFGFTDQDQFGCGHSDDSESTGSKTGEIVGTALVQLLDANGGSQANPENIVEGRYILATPDSKTFTLSRDPLGTPESLMCSQNTVFAPNASGSASGVWLAPPAGSDGQGEVVVPSQWMSLSGAPQTAPDRNTRGFILHGVRYWLDVFPDVTAPAKVTLQQRIAELQGKIAKIVPDVEGLPGGVSGLA
ncbi:MAG: hypothetical protein ACYDD4_07555 [Acidimicrobiales bacterium]